MVDVSLLQEVIISLGIGTLIGIEREHHFMGEEEFAGLRTFALISLFGTVCSILADTYGFWLVMIGLASTSALALLGYVLTFEVRKSVGMTTEVVFITTYILGTLVHVTNPGTPIALSIIVTLVLAIKAYTRKIAEKIKKIEILDTLKFAIIAFIILPLLPNQTIDPYNILNPYHLWLLVIFISGISFFGYFLTKLFGAGEGIVLTGILGGLASSTAVAVAMADEVKKDKKITTPAAVGVIVASTLMFFRMLIEIMVVNIELLPALLPPILGMGLVGTIASWYMIKDATKFEHELELESPFSIGPALEFTILFIIILFATHFGNQLFGDAGLYLTSFIAGLADVDAITLSLASMAKTEITTQVATLAIIIAALTNTFVKAGITFIFGRKELGIKVLKVFTLMGIVGVTITILL